MKKYNAFQNMLFLLRDIKRGYKLLLLFLILEMAAGSVLPLFGLYLPKIAVDLVTEQAAAVRAITVLGGLTLLYILVLRRV